MKNTVSGSFKCTHFRFNPSVCSVSNAEYTESYFKPGITGSNISSRSPITNKNIQQNLWFSCLSDLPSSSKALQQLGHLGTQASEVSWLIHNQINKPHAQFIGHQTILKQSKSQAFQQAPTLPKSSRAGFLPQLYSGESCRQFYVRFNLLSQWDKPLMDVTGK